jgi:hypothetical protein
MLTQMAKSLDFLVQKVDTNGDAVRVLNSSVQAPITHQSSFFSIIESQAEQKSEIERISRALAKLETRIGILETARGDKPPSVQDSRPKAGAAMVPKKMKGPNAGQKRSYEHLEDQDLSDHGVEEDYSRGNGGGSKRQKLL